VPRARTRARRRAGSQGLRPGEGRALLQALKPPRVVQITDRATLDESALAVRLERARAAGAAHRAGLAILLRDKALPPNERRTLAMRLREMTRAADAVLIVAADLDLALAVGADGVHAASGDLGLLERAAGRMPHGLRSIACHAPEEVVTAANAGATAAMLSPIFQSPGKGPPIGVSALTRARELLGGAPHVLLVALGGIDARTAPACFAAGADAVASIRADLTSVLV
jgi:thiamine-phosphate pyrophosphorylase